LPALLAQLKVTHEDALAHTDSDPSPPSLD